jgi:hypothetical protein
VLEGPLLPDEAPTPDSPSAGQPGDLELVRGVWGEIRAAVEKVVRGITLEDLCQRKREQAGKVMYYI